MGSNVTQVSGATEIELYFRNYTYATAVSDMEPLSLVLFTDLERLGYKNAGGALRKIMEDASGSSNIPGDRVLISDSNGRVTSDSDLTYDSNGLGFGNTFSLHTTATKVEIYKNGSPTGSILYEE